MARGHPTQKEWKRFFRQIPLWVVILIVALLYGRLVLVAVWHWLLG